jgi:hypothetical protein
VLGYGWSALTHDRLGYFHSLLAGHSANYISRGTFWGSEQRQQLGVDNERWRNGASLGGDGGEDGSLCMVSAVAPSMWVRWMLLQDYQTDLFTQPTSSAGTSSVSVMVYIARGAPRRWYNSTDPFGITNGPTRVGRVTYSIHLINNTAVGGSISLTANPGQVLPTTLADAVLFAVKVRAPRLGMVLARVDVVGGGATVVAMHTLNETVVFAPTKAKANGEQEATAAFEFAASFQSN